MRNIMIFAAVLAVLGTFMANVADKMTSEKAQAKAVASARSMNAFASMQPEPVSSRGRSLSVRGSQLVLRDADSHVAHGRP